jgi:SAM-dependent methyltransferase
LDLDELQRLSTGFTKAKVLLAAADLGLYEIARGSGITAAEAARKIDGDPRGTEILLDALVAVGIFSKQEGRYRVVAELEAELRDDAPSQAVWMLRHRNRMFRHWALIEDRILGREQAPGSDREMLHDADANRDFIRAMVSASGTMAAGVVDRIDLTGVRRIADMGGGPGHYAREFAGRGESIEVWLLDLPQTIETARELGRYATDDASVHPVAWNFYDEQAPPELPPFDLVFLSQVLHSESPERNRGLFGTIAALLAPEGRLVVHEFFVGPDRTTPPDAALFAVNMLAMTPAGRSYTVGEVEDWARAAGLEPGAFEQAGERSGLLTLHNR